MKATIIIVLVGLLSATALSAQIKNARTETINVFGNCDMCKTNIEKAGSKSNIYKTDWNAETKTALITYDSKKTTVDEALKNIALAGYDNARFLAPSEAYNQLHGCCKYERETKATLAAHNLPIEISQQHHTGHGQNTTRSNQQESDQLKTVFDQYFALKDALVKTDGAAASVNGASLLTALNAVDMAKLATAQHTVWINLQAELKSDAQHIKDTKDTEHQRDHFISLSKNMYEVIKVAKTAQTVYYQFCPMANDGKGANWLSKESAVKNPYYGAQMLSCGKVVETIKN